RYPAQWAAINSYIPLKLCRFTIVAPSHYFRVLHHSVYLIL
ncbi:MAG: hypothetical protein ACI9CO_002377, partial [Candidatus Azotimanducaceae bacterium]